MSVSYFGDFAEDDTVNIPFNTFSSNDPSASVTITNLADADIKVHKDGGTTEIATDGATVAIDFDGITGNHLITIDTSAHSDYSTGSEYQVRIEGTTVDGGTINAWVGSFSIERAGGALSILKHADYGNAQLVRSTTPANSLDVNATGEAGLDLDNTSGTLDAGQIGADAITAAKIADDSITADQLGANAITSTILADNAITAAKINADAITNAKIADNALAVEQFADNFLTAAKINADAITAAKIANAAIDNATFAADVGSTAYATNIVALAVRKTMDELNLDHLAKTATGGADMTTEVADNTVLSRIMANGDTSAFDPSTDGLQPIRDRGDAAWTTGGGGSISDIINIQPIIPNDIDLANTATYRVGIMLINSLDDLPSTAEITPGTISIDRKAIGGTSWSSIVSDASMSEIAGLVYYDEVFDSGTNYAEGDSIRVTMKSVKVTVAANDYEIIGATGRMFYTSVRQTMRGTDSAATASALSTHDGKLDTAQADLDTITGADGTTLATTQGNYAPSKAGDLMGLANDAITSAKYDESTAFPVKSDDAGATQIARTGADSDTLETLSDQIDAVPTAAENVNEWETQSQADPTGFHVNMMEMNSVSAAVVRLALSAGQIIPGTVDNTVAPTTTVFEADDITEATADHFNGRIVIFTSGVLAGQATDITDYALNGSNGQFTVTALTEAPANNDTFFIV
jgi:hypothetical protein